MKKLLKFKYGELGFFSIALFINFVLTTILFSLKLSESKMSIWNTVGYSRIINQSIWDSSPVYIKEMTFIGVVSIILLVFFIVGFFLSLGSILLHKFKNEKWGYYIATFFHIVMNIVILTLHVLHSMISIGAIVLAFLNIVLMTLVLCVTLYLRPKSQEEKERESKDDKRYKILMLVMQSISMFLVFILFFIPLFTKKVEVIDPELVTSLQNRLYILVHIFGVNSYELFISIIFILFMLIIFSSFLYFITTISYFSKKDKSFAKKSKSSIYGNVGVTLLFFLVGYFICFYFGTKQITTYTISYIPFIISLAVLIIYSIFEGKYTSDIQDSKEITKEKNYKFEPLIYVLILSILTLLSLAINIIQVQFTFSFNEVPIANNSVSLSGYKLLTTYNILDGGFQLLSFIVFSFLLISGILFVLSVASFFAKYRDYYKIIKLDVIANVMIVFLLGLFGLYFKIAQKINEDALNSLLTSFQFNVEDYQYTYSIASQAIYLFIGSFIVLLIMIFRGQLNHQIADETILKLSKESDFYSKDRKKEVGGALETIVNIEFDACPAFTELDSKLESFKENLEDRRQQVFSNLTLPNLVRFIVDYARECRLHLSYSLEDIATFVAGLGASRLTILQGMSGTGKTSLPKIFAEAILGNCEIVEVESSWRDKNELLGYYNEFSKCYTPKKFTQCLYKARLNSEIPTFIVLDEMNLSRIEYYFSDFLSLMEHEEDKREIKLLNIKLSRIVEGETHQYYGLTDGHTIKIPTNVWFIGTANRDESTFEISDKVYDRAQTMNFNKRAPKIHSYSEPLEQKFISYAQISELFEEAKKTYTFEAEDNKTIQKVEQLLTPYNISFGNRILKQMEDFVKIYCACFGDKNAVVDSAIEKILLSKVVSKLEFKIVENKETLALEFEKLGLALCGAFIRKLNED